jgi:hypothetical protein
MPKEKKARKKIKKDKQLIEERKPLELSKDDLSSITTGVLGGVPASDEQMGKICYGGYVWCRMFEKKCAREH